MGQINPNTDEHNPALKLTPTQQEVIDAITDNKVVVFAKSTCPFCKKTKELLAKGQIDAKIIELDKRSDGKEMQDFFKPKIHFKRSKIFSAHERQRTRPGAPRTRP